MDQTSGQPEIAQATPSRSELIILLAAAISIEAFALITFVFQILGWGGVSGWGWLGALVQAALLLAIAIVTPLLIRDLLARLSNKPSPGDGEKEEVTN
jgi:membrane protein implicated in regulation of membrane protease activity